MKFWYRLVTLPKSRLVSHCYWSLYDLPNLKDPWFSSIRDIIATAGQFNSNFLWDSQRLLSEVDYKFVSKAHSQIVKSLKEQYLSAAVEKLNTETKLSYFKEAKTEFSLSNYLTVITHRNTRSLISKLRLGVLDLEIEKGRKVKINSEGIKTSTDRSERFCQICATTEVEDEIHFLFSCPQLSQTRTENMAPLLLLREELLGASRVDKLMYLFFNENLVSEELSLAATLLS